MIGLPRPASDRDAQVFTGFILECGAINITTRESGCYRCTSSLPPLL